MSNAIEATDIERVQEFVGAFRGGQVAEVERELADHRDGVVILAEKIAGTAGLSSPVAVFVAALRRGEHKRRMKTVSTTEEGKGPRAPERIPAIVALRRLYDAKLGDLARVGVREPDRITIAVDYACGEVWRCSILPMPEGGIVRLEDELYAAIGFDRVTGVRFPPQT